MNGIMDENQLTKIEEYESIKPLIHKIDSIIDNCYKYLCLDKYFHTFEFKCVYKIELTNIGNDEIADLTISDENMGLLEINKKLTVARQNGIIFNQKNKVTKIFL